MQSSIILSGRFLRLTVANFCFFMTFATFFLLPLHVRALGGRSRRYQSQSQRDPVHVGIDGDRVVAEREALDHRGRLRPHAGEL